MVSQKERDVRLAGLDKLMEINGIDACVIIGSGVWGKKEYGYFRYFVDNRIYYYIQALVAVKGEKPTVICGSPTHLAVLQSRGFEDIIMRGDGIKNGIAETLERRGLKKSIVGFCKDTIPASWYDLLKARLPEVTFKDISEILYSLREERSEEEQKISVVAVSIVDEALKTVPKFISYGISENAVSAELSYSMKKNKAEECMVRLEITDKATSVNPAIHTAFNSNRTFGHENHLLLELSARYEGYWARCARTVCQDNLMRSDERCLSAVLQSIDAAALQLKPGKKISETESALNMSLEKLGFSKNDDAGTICGVDLCEIPVNSSSEETYVAGQTVFLHAYAADKGSCGVLFGDMYLVTENGGRRLSSGERKLICVE